MDEKSIIITANSTGTLCSQPQENIRPLPTVLPAFTSSSRQISHVGIGGQSLGDLLHGFDAADCDQTIAGLGDSSAENLGAFGFALGANHIGLAFLFGLFDDEA